MDPERGDFKVHKLIVEVLAPWVLKEVRFDFDMAWERDLENVN